MLTITSNEQANSLIKDGVLYVDDDIEIAFDGFRIDADIKCRNISSKGRPRDINAKDINAGDIYAEDIKADNINAFNIDVMDIIAWDIIAKNIDASNISANNIKAKNIEARNIIADDIEALNIDARDIDAKNITAETIEYYAICVAYEAIICASINGRKENSRHFCRKGEITIKGKLKC